MEGKTLNGDTVIKSWDYAKTKGLIFTKGRYNLTVTGKRVISTAQTKISNTKTEILKSEISGVSVSNGNGSLVPGIVFLIIGIAFMLSAIALMPLIAAGIFFIIAGIVAIICRGASISVTLYIKSHSEPFLSANGITRRRRAKKLKVKVDKDVANSIANELTAYILAD